MDMNNVFAGTNWQEVKAAGGGREVFSEGWTQVVIADSVGKENNGKTGFGLTLYLKAVSGENAGKTIDDFLNVFHQKPDVQRIGQEQFSAYCHAIGEFKPIDNHYTNGRGKPFWVRTVIEESEYTPDGKTDVIKTKRSRVKDWDTNNGTKHGAAASGNASNGAGTQTTPPPAQTAPQTSAPASQPQTAPIEAPVTPGWGPPPPGAGSAPAATGGAPWGAGGAQQAAAPAATNAAPWNAG